MKRNKVMGWEFVKLGDLVHRKIGYGIVQPGANVDVGVPVLSMHAPYEVVAKLDVYMTYKAFAAFIK